MGAVAAALSMVVAACGSQHPVLTELLEADDCRTTVVVGREAERLESLETDSLRAAALEEARVEWTMPSESADVSRLNAWCAAVGPAVVGGWGDTVAATPVADTLWLVSWNVHVGGGDLPALVSDLRAGRLTGGREVNDFVLLLQEAHRGGDLVPEPEPGEPFGSGVMDPPPSGVREDIVRTAERLGLWLIYVPSMRNGDSEDRGNAILSTLPLRDPVAMGLPVARQRRVALAARTAGRTASGRDWRVQLASVHLESSPSGWESDEEQRLNQAEALLDLLPEAEVAVAAGDFNTKTRGTEEALVRPMLRAYPDTPDFPPGPTYQKVYGIYREYLDYIFFRLPDDVDADYTRVPRIYASDHYPLVGRIVW